MGKSDEQAAKEMPLSADAWKCVAELALDTLKPIAQALGGAETLRYLCEPDWNPDAHFPFPDGIDGPLTLTIQECRQVLHHVCEHDELLEAAAKEYPQKPPAVPATDEGIARECAPFQFPRNEAGATDGWRLDPNYVTITRKSACEVPCGVSPSGGVYHEYPTEEEVECVLLAIEGDVELAIQRAIERDRAGRGAVVRGEQAEAMTPLLSTDEKRRILERMGAEIIDDHHGELWRPGSDKVFERIADFDPATNPAHFALCINKLKIDIEHDAMGQTSLVCAFTHGGIEGFGKTAEEAVAACLRKIARKQ